MKRKMIRIALALGIIAVLTMLISFDVEIELPKNPNKLVQISEALSVQGVE